MFKNSIIIIFVFFLYACSSSPPEIQEKINPAKLVELKKYKIYSSNRHLRDGIYLQTKGYLEPVESEKNADLIIEVQDDILIDRTLSAKMFGNIFSLLVGYFFYSFDIETNFAWKMEVKGKALKNFQHQTNVQNNYPYMGYIDQYEEGLEKRHIFYKDIFEEEKSKLGLKAGKEIILLLSKEL